MAQEQHLYISGLKAHSFATAIVVDGTRIQLKFKKHRLDLTDQPEVAAEFDKELAKHAQVRKYVKKVNRAAIDRLATNAIKNMSQAAQGPYTTQNKDDMMDTLSTQKKDLQQSNLGHGSENVAQNISDTQEALGDDQMMATETVDQGAASESTVGEIPSKSEVESPIQIKL